MNYKKIICQLINFIKFPEAYMFFRKKIFGRHIVVFVYHRVHPGKGNARVANICPEEFEKQIRYLKINFDIYSIDKLINVLKNNQIDNEGIKNIAVVTFDDGYKDNYVYAYPILKKYKIPASIFLITDYIGKGKLFWWDEIKYILYYTKKEKINLLNLGTFLLTDNEKKFSCFLFLLKKFKKMSSELKNKYINDLQNVCNVIIPLDLGKKRILSWDEICEMKDNGISFGAHTLTHTNLKNADLEEAEKEIVQSKAMIEKKVKTNVRSFAYPYGSKFYGNKIVKLLKNNGFDCAFTTSEKLINQFKFCNIYSLPRISAGNDFDSFTIKASGIFLDFYNMFKLRK